MNVESLYRTLDEPRSPEIEVQNAKWVNRTGFDG